jgi:hypothetical protein
MPGRLIKEKFRSRKLAEAYADDNDLEIVARRNSKGHKSKRGWNWTFRPEEEEEEGDIDLFPNREWLVSVSYQKGKRPFTADLFIIASADATPTELADQSRLQLGKGKNFIANWIEGSFANISQGDLTNERPATFLRSFQRRVE